MRNTLYLKRPLENASDLIAWAKSQGFETTLPAGDMHVTIAYSKLATEWPTARDDRVVVLSKSNRVVQPLGDGGAVVLRFENATVQSRWDEVRKLGAVWSFPEYKPHVTITWDASGVDLSKVKPYDGDLVFGPEIMRAIDDDWKDKLVEKLMQEQHNIPMDVVKVNEELGLIFGWAIISKIGGIEYFDTQGDHIPEQSMLKASFKFMIKSRQAKEMHVGVSKGTVVFAFPLTGDIAKAMSVSSPYTGLMIAVKPDDPSVLEKVRDGTFTGFSIGGHRIKETYV